MKNLRNRKLFQNALMKLESQRQHLLTHARTTSTIKNLTLDIVRSKINIIRQMGYGVPSKRRLATTLHKCPKLIALKQRNLLTPLQSQIEPMVPATPLGVYPNQEEMLDLLKNLGIQTLDLLRRVENTTGPIRKRH